MRASIPARMYRQADRSFALLTRPGLRRCGFSDSAIGRLVQAGQLLVVHRAVYRLPGTPRSPEQRALAACWACGPGAVASHRIAAGLWKLLERPNGLVEVTLPYPRRASHAGIIVHRSKRLGPDDVTSIGTIPITRVARTIVDLPRHLQEEALDTAIRQRRVTPDIFIDAPGYLGRLARDRLGLGVPHEKIERKAIAVMRKYRLPAAIRQYPITVAGRNYFIDLAYPDEKVAIELKGEAPHWGRERFQYDIDRSNALKLAGWDEYTFTWWHVTERGAALAATVVAALRTSADLRR